MKTCLRIVAIIFLALGVLLNAYPASAGATKVDFTGTMYFLTSGEPVERFWESGMTNQHGRNEVQGYYFETTAPAFNGYAWGHVDWDFHWNADWSLRFAHIYGTIIIAADEQGHNVLWECQSNSTIDEYWMGFISGVCHGRGVNEGLMAKFTGVANFGAGDDYGLIQGEILDPGGE